MIRWIASLVALFGAAAGHLTLSTELPIDAQWDLALGAAADNFEQIAFLHAALPRTAIAVVAGAALGLAGSVLQQITQNRLVAPITIGAASGAWLALILGAVLAPSIAANQKVLLAMTGALGATGAVLAIAGRRGIGGLPVVLAGMAMHILLGAIATIVILLHEERVQNLFIWGAGDLTQTDWSWAGWLAPQVGVIGVLIVLLTPRSLTLMRLGTAGAAGRGLNVWPFVLLSLLAALWLTSSVITAVGVIAFMGLLAPNIARVAGAHTARGELILAALLGALLMVATDAAAVWASTWTRDLVPSGASAALIGLPALIWLSLGRALGARDHTSFRPPGALVRDRRVAAPVLGLAAAVLVVVAMGVAPTDDGWRVGWPSEQLASLRWPRVMTAFAAGAGMALSGVILQRLLRNPLASPDIVGISAGATLALVIGVLAFGGTIYDLGAPVALLGGLSVLGLLIVLGHRHQNAPNVVALIGISLAALLEAALRFVLAKGGEETYMIVGWLAGSTFRTTDAEASTLLAGVGALMVLAFALNRWLTLLSVDDTVAASRGLAVPRAKLALLSLAAVVAALVTAVVGPIAFIGLLAPHAAAMLGAANVRAQIPVAALTGAALLVLSDWLGRTLFYPFQLPAGATASVIGGVYFVFLLTRGGKVGRT